MNNGTLLGTGIIGAALAALCCLTPVLVILLGVVGLSAWVGCLDYVLLPALAVFLAITGYALYRRQCAAAGAACVPDAEKPVAEDSP